MSENCSDCLSALDGAVTSHALMPVPARDLDLESGTYGVVIDDVCTTINKLWGVIPRTYAPVNRRLAIKKEFQEVN